MLKTGNSLFVLMFIVTILLSGAGIIYSQVTDIDGNKYKTAIIGYQEWMTENLNVTRYRNGDTIPQVQDPEEWNKLSTGAWCYYENKTTYGSLFGKLYNWYAVTDPRGLAPEGWHIPYMLDWKSLVDFLGEKNAGRKMKTNYEWLEDGEISTNESEFTGLPGGYRGAMKKSENKGEFYNIRTDGAWWSISNYNDDIVYGVNLNAYSNEIKFYRQNMNNGLSVRCTRQ